MFWPIVYSSRARNSSMAPKRAPASGEAVGVGDGLCRAAFAPSSGACVCVAMGRKPIREAPTPALAARARASISNGGNSVVLMVVVLPSPAQNWIFSDGKQIVWEMTCT